MMKSTHRVFRSFLISTLVLGALTGPGASLASAFLYEVEVLDKAGISKLKDEQLLDRYIDTVVEIEASTIFHKSSGFNPKEYKGYKNLLRFRADLIQEIHQRELELPQVTP